MHDHTDLLVLPMREDLTKIGFIELKTAEEAKYFFENEKRTVLLVVNSVCGCAAGNARPAVKLAVNSKIKPEVLATVFAGQDREATQTARSYFPEYEPSSPSMVLLKDGKAVFMLGRDKIEGRNAEEISKDLIEAFEKYF